MLREIWVLYLITGFTEKIFRRCMHATSWNFFIYRGAKFHEGNHIEDLRFISETPYFLKLLEIILKKRIETDIAEASPKKYTLQNISLKNTFRTEPEILRPALEQAYLRIQVKKEKSSSKNFVLFIDLKSAFDNVNWTKLFNKMSKLNYSITIVNKIKQLDLSACTFPSMLNRSIKIKKRTSPGRNTFAVPLQYLYRWLSITTQLSSP